MSAVCSCCMLLCLLACTVARPDFVHDLAPLWLAFQAFQYLSSYIPSKSHTIHPPTYTSTCKIHEPLVSHPPRRCLSDHPAPCSRATASVLSEASLLAAGCALARDLMPLHNYTLTATSRTFHAIVNEIQTCPNHFHTNAELLS